MPDRRKQEEAEFHDRRERDRQRLSAEDYDVRYANKRWYALTARSRRHVGRLLDDWAPGARVLDYCCGLGASSVDLARRGAFVDGIDISSESIATARETARAAGLADRCDFRVMDAEALEFPDRRFDLIVCAGVLHHLDVARAYPQLARVLAPDGRILCTEPLGYNPAIQLYRRLTPHMRTAWEADHILTRREIDLAGRWFAAIDLTYFHLADLMAYPLRQTRLLTPALGLLGRLDQLLLSVPGLQLMAWQVVMVLSEPHPPQGR